tara:strand:+ start:75026 stop:76867 length:1842 start_codon:yes stop_codon:yes gene_type:complete
MPRLIVIPLVIIAVLILAAVLLVPLLLDKDKVLELAANALHEQTGATLTVEGESSLSFFPTLGVQLGQASVAMPGEEEPGLRVETLEIGVQLMPLLSKRIEIDTLRLDGMAARILSEPAPDAVDTSKLSNAQLDAFYAQRRKEKEQAAQSAGAEAALAAPLALNVQRLSVTNSEITMVDKASGDATTIALQSLEASGLNLDGDAIPIALRARLVQEQPIDVALDAAVRIDLQQQQITLADTKVTVTGATAQPLKLDTSGTVDINRQIADLTLNITLGDTRGDGTLRYASFESPQIDTTLHLNKLDPALLALAGPAAADAPEPAADASGDEPLPLDALRGIDTRADLTIDEAIFGAHTVQQLRARLRAVDGVIAVREMSGQLHGGMLDMKATFNARHNTATLDTVGGLTGLNIASALQAMESEPVFTGAASVQWTLKGSGTTQNALIESLDGPIRLTTTDPVLEGMSLEGLLCQAVALVNQEKLTAPFEPRTEFSELGAEMQLAGGQLKLQPLQAQLPRLALTGSGGLNLLKQNFNTTFKAKLSPELEELDPACRVSKRLTAIEWPVNCKGELAGEPAKWCMVDTAAIISDLATYEVQRKVEKEAGKLFEKLFK